MPPQIATKANWPPNYLPIYQWRQAELARLKADPVRLAGALEYYRTHRVEFILHWMDTYDPRNAGQPGKLTNMPFVLFQRQAELVEFIDALIMGQTDGLIEKCRDAGATWVACAISWHLWRFVPGAAIGWGSRKEDLVDKSGDTKSIFEKMRQITRALPRIFWPLGFDPSKHSTFMKIINPANGATITGESGDNIGRGGRTLVYFKDESAHYQRPELIEASLSENTNCQVDISSVCGLGNPFHRKRENGIEWMPGQPAVKWKTNVFIFDVFDNPAKTKEWYDNRKAKFEGDGMAHIFAQEVDRDYAASQAGVIIQAKWVKAAIDAHSKLDIAINGARMGGFDPADGGLDKNGWCERHGVLLTSADQWADRDPAKSARRTLGLCALQKDKITVQYDPIGVGASVKGEINGLKDRAFEAREAGEIVSENMMRLLDKNINFVAWNAGSTPLNPHDHLNDDPEMPLNSAYFQNIKAQGWYMLARRFYKTWMMVEGLGDYPHDELISIDPDLPFLRTLEKELCQPVMTQSTGTLKQMVDKQPEGTASPNIGDSVMMCYWPVIEPDFEWYVG